MSPGVLLKGSAIQEERVCASVARFVPQSLHVSSFVIPQSLRFVVVGNRSYVDLSRKLSRRGSIEKKDGQVIFFDSACSQFIQVHCLAKQTAFVLRFCSSWLRISSVTISRAPTASCLENQRCCVWPSPALPTCVAPHNSLKCKLDSASVIASEGVHFLPVFSSGLASWIAWSGVSRNIIW